MAIPELELAMNAERCIFDENFGLVDPIGSNKKILSKKIYLNDGKGDPWAGQVMATPELELVLKPENSNFDENFGFVDPIGSNLKIFL